MEDVSRRSLFRIIGATAAGSVVISPALAQHIHTAVAQVKKTAYKPRAFSAHYYATLKKLADMIIPPDEHSGGAVEAGAPEFIDLLSSHNPDLAEIFNGGMTWLDQTMHQRYGTDFVSSKPEQQTAMLDSLAWAKNITAETAHGTRFWTMLRNMVVDAFYTSPAGVKDLGYMGNTAVAKFEVPDEAVQYVMKRSPLTNVV